MKKNLPVTNNQCVFPSGQRLISATDLQGNLTYCNEEFASISGYSREELIGSPHNIVRHPDMPEAVFKQMWSYLRSGRSWMGVVKNRCKNGDFYWVSAYVTPIMEDGRLTGYESVRVNPTRKQIERAELLYARLLIGKPAIPLLRKFMVVLCRYVVSIIAGMVACGATLLLPSLAALSVTFILFLASGWWICARQEKVLKEIFKTVPHAFKDSLSSLTYSDRPGSLEIGRAHV